MFKVVSRSVTAQSTMWRVTAVLQRTAAQSHSGSGVALLSHCRHASTQRGPKTPKAATDAPVSSKEADLPAVKCPLQSTSGSSPSDSVENCLNSIQYLQERHRGLQNTIQIHEETIAMLRSRCAAFDQRIGHCEETVAQLQAKLSETQRMVGSVVLDQRNTTVLVQQMERRLTAPPPQPPPTIEEQASRVESPVGVSREAIAALTGQVAELQTRLNEITTNIFCSDRIMTFCKDSGIPLAAAEEAVKQVSCPPALGSHGGGKRGGTESPREAKRGLHQLIHDRHVVPFTDASGATRWCTQQVVIHNVPLNMSAGEIHEICTQHVCEGRRQDIISCVVRRSPSSAPMRASTAPKETSDVATPRYRSTIARSSSEPSRSPSTSTATSGSGCSHADAQPSIEPHTKSCEVVFTSATLALQAFRVLGRVFLRTSTSSHGTPVQLIVEPIVSAEVLAALSAQL